MEPRTKTWDPRRSAGNTLAQAGKCCGLSSGKTYAKNNKGIRECLIYSKASRKTQVVARLVAIKTSMSIKVAHKKHLENVYRSVESKASPVR